MMREREASSTAPLSLSLSEISPQIRGTRDPDPSGAHPRPSLDQGPGATPRAASRSDQECEVGGGRA